MALLLEINWSFISPEWHAALSRRYAGERLDHYLLAGGIVLAALLLRRPLTSLIASLGYLVVRRAADEQHGRRFRETLRKPLGLFISTLLVYIAIQQLQDHLQRFVVQRVRVRNNPLAIQAGDVVDHVFLFLLICFGTWTFSRVADYIYSVLREKAQRARDRSRLQLLPLIKELLKLLLWATAFFWILGAVFEVNIPALITGLGIGGVAIALAAKESVENLFAAFTILTDKPFEAGDVVRLGTLEGTVERIGFRSTRLRHADGSAYIIPNRKLVAENLENLTNRDTRRVRLTVQIKYGMPADQLKTLIDAMKQQVQSTAHVGDKVSVSVESFNENTFLLQVTYVLPHPMRESSPDAVKQEVNYAIYSLLTQYTAQGAVSVEETPKPPLEEEEVPDDEEESTL